jgi:hypothetical protein
MRDVLAGGFPQGASQNGWAEATRLISEKRLITHLSLLFILAPHIRMQLFCI